MSVCTSEGFPEVARFHTGRAVPELKWSPAGQLCIAQSFCWSADLSLLCSVDMPHKACSSAKCSALIWDPELAAVVHSLGPAVSALLHKPEARYWTEHVAWSTSCLYLLAQGASGSGYTGDEDYNPCEGRVSGWLVIADVVQGTVVAKSRVSLTEGRSCDNPFAIMWVPHAQAEILQPSTQVENLLSLMQAGFAVGNLPKGSGMVGAKFSPFADFLAVQSDRSAVEVQLLSCSIVGPQVCLRLVQTFQRISASHAIFSFGWLPESSVLYMQRDHDFVLYEHEKQVRCQKADLGEDQNCQSLSHSGKLAILASWTRDGFYIICMDSGQTCWGLPCPQGCMTNEGGRSALSYNVSVCGWMPTGLGLICRREAVGIGPPSVRMYWFA